VKYLPFYVGNRPMACWGEDLRSENLRFLRTVDGAYYEHVAEAHAPYLDGSSRLEAAAAIRIAYSQGLETLFALLLAGMQAPLCVAGWMQNYRTVELKRLVRDVSSGTPPWVRHQFLPLTWESAAGHFLGLADWEGDGNDWIPPGFGRLWANFASDFVDEDATLEYNAMKHGSRPRLGGFELLMGIQEGPGIPAPIEDAVSMGGSEFGSSYYKQEYVGRQKLHFTLGHSSRNWSPVNLGHGLLLIAYSIQNVASFLRLANGDESAGCDFSAPLDVDSFDLPWTDPVGAQKLTFSRRPDFRSENLPSKIELVSQIEEDHSPSS